MRYLGKLYKQGVLVWRLESITMLP